MINPNKDLCTKLDDFLDEKTIWEIQLNNGIWVYQDDYRPDVQPYSAWIRLKLFLEQNTHLYIEQMRFRFRDHVEVLPIQEADAYYFSKSLGSIIGSGQVHHHYIGGALIPKTSTIKCWKYKIPELIVVETSYKRLDKTANLIWCQ